jgi:serpin B
MKLLLLVALGVVSTLADDAQLLKDFTDGNVKFTASVYKELLKSNSGNFLVCPLSVDVVLALVHAGAKGNTAKQLTDGLQLPETPELVQQTFGALAPKLQGNEFYNLSSANKIYVKDSFQISDSYKTTAVNVFQAEIDNIDFTKNEVAAKTMNSWVEKQTHDKIKDLISKDDLDEDTRLVLINAMYFHGNWDSKFEKYATRKRDFFLNNNDKVEIDMMEQTHSYKYYESQELNAKFLEMPYKGGDISMTIVLPNDKEGLGALEANIEKVLVQPSYSFERVHVVLPKFKIESTIKFKPILQNLGIVDAFEDNADFTGIGANQEPLKISKVIQKAFIEVEEEGTTAAAATAAIAVSRSGGIRKIKQSEFVADHPFVFILSHNSAAHLFVGRYSAP